ncbi:uncharacterized protein LOC130793298 [Actinidia eriantha]|uniref:uncharacterized protein LOC130793298 n=1 Tax=Actinidia eriantha TaxID=165200 RepID=UPI002584DCC8|nr:uncharacterized protein LOC130793298 [Actinidia eriantha]
MKGSWTLITSVLAASTVALTSSSNRDLAFYPSSNEGYSPSSSSSSSLGKGGVSSSHRSSSYKEKFAPRFDGLRFIETLVTAHR